MIAVGLKATSQDMKDLDSRTSVNSMSGVKVVITAKRRCCRLAGQISKRYELESMLPMNGSFTQMVFVGIPMNML